MKNMPKKSWMQTEAAGILFFIIALLLLTLLLTYSSEDPTAFYVTSQTTTNNLVGQAGAWLAGYLYYWFGLAAYLLVLFAALMGYRFFYHIAPNPSLYVRIIKRLAYLLFILSSTALLSLHMSEATASLPSSAGGIIGFIIAQKTAILFGFFGSNLILLTLCLVSFSLITGLSWLQFIETIGGLVLFLAAKLHLGSLGNIPLIPKQLAINMLSSVNQSIRTKQTKNTQTTIPSSKKRVEPHFAFMPGRGTEAKLKENKDPQIIIEDKTDQIGTQRDTKDTKDKMNTVSSIASPINRNIENDIPLPNLPNRMLKNIESKAAQPVPRQTANKQFLPSVDYLNSPEPVHHLTAEEYQILGQQLVANLSDFGVTVELKGYQPGPIITLFELEPAAGVKAARISALAQDLARSMAVENIRVIEFISGKSVVGIEIPNQKRKTVRMKELLSSAEYKTSSQILPLALGQNIEGKPVIASLADMPHLLVAGTTGSGKSIGINVMIVSLLYKYGPKELKLMLVDPKMLELSVYNNIPHLLVPVITDMSKAAQGLGWCIQEMDNRYTLMAKLGVRNIESYNNALANKPMDQADGHSHLPYLVIVIDEFADLIMTDKKVEDIIVRLAQKARAAGIHLILATQRPSVNVVTGLIKANIPARISFKVSAKVDSRTVLDQSGAEQLLGKGDMLYSATGGSQIRRIHGAFIEDGEIRQVTAHWKEQEEPDYQEDIFKAKSLNNTTTQEEADDLYNDAINFITESNRVSISSVQRKFKIGYNRAARIIELMEKDGLVSPMDQSGKRTVVK